jgi:hypothetical protein
VDAVCLFVAGAVAAALAGPEFTLRWVHSVARTRWEEVYRLEGEVLVLTEARIEGSGAGMEPPPEARRDGAHWVWRPDRRLPELRLTYSAGVRDYTVCDAAGCRSLGDRAGALADGTVVAIRPCVTRGR